MKRKALLLINLVLALLMVFSSVCFAFTSVPVKSISLNKSSLTLNAGTTATLIAVISPANATNKTIKWSSSDNKIAKVNAKGVVTGVKAGKATITVKSADGKATAKCIVTVSQVKVIDVSVLVHAKHFDDQKAMKNDRIIKWIQDKFKINLKLSTGRDADYATKMMLDWSSGQAADYNDLIPWESTCQQLLAKAVDEDLVLDMGAIVAKDPGRYSTLNAIFNDPAYKYVCEQNIPNNNGRALCTWNITNDGLQCNGAPVYNMRIMNKLGLTAPENPTVDEFLQLLRKIKQKDPNIIPFSYFTYKGDSVFMDMQDSIFPAFGAKGMSNISPQNELFTVWGSSATSDGAKNAIKFMATLYKEGLLDKEFLSRTSWSNIDDFAAGKIAVIMAATPNQYSGQIRWIYQKYLEVNPNATFADVYMSPKGITGPNGAHPVRYVPAVSIYDCGLIPKSCKNPERVLDLVNWIFSVEGQTMSYYGIEGVHYTKDAGGNMKFNNQEWLKDINVYYGKDNTGIYMWPNFVYSFVTYTPKIMDFKKNGFLEGSAKGVDAITYENPAAYSSNRFDQSAQSIKTNNYYGPIGAQYRKTYGVALPIWASFIGGWSDMESKMISKINDLITTSYCKFVVGQLDVDKDWDAYVKQLADAGLDDYVKIYNKKVAGSKKQWDKINK